MTLQETKSRLSLEDTARQLAEANGRSEQAIASIYWFPAEGEIRLVVVDSTTAPMKPGERIAPFYFGPDPEGEVPYRSAIADVAPGDERIAELPQGWGDWDGARVIWERP